MDNLKKTATDDDDDCNGHNEEETSLIQPSSHPDESGTDSVDDVGDNDDEPSQDIFTEVPEPRHKTILGGDASASAKVSLHRCNILGCCDNRVHCPFCDVRQYKPTQPARVRDHLHLTHFQHAVYYDGMMIVKCFHACRGNSTKGGHYHCPVCSTTLLKRNAFTSHLLSHATKQGLDSSTVQAPDNKKPSVIYYDDHKIELCHQPCMNMLEPHFHCPLCRRSCKHLSALMAHLWRCEKRATSMASKVDMTGYSLNVPKLFSPEMVQCMPLVKDLKAYKWHLSIVRNLSDLPLVRCELSDCCKGRYHCPLCTTAKLKPNHLCHMKQHLVSHWRSGVPFKSYTVLVCYLPCELSEGVDRIRFHYHCPICGATRRRRQSFARHLQICDPTKPTRQASEEEIEEEEEEEGGGEDDGGGALGKFPVDGDHFVPLSESDAWPTQSVVLELAQVTTSRRASADQAELQAAESLVDLDLRIQMESLKKTTESVDSRVVVESADTLTESSDRVVLQVKGAGCCDQKTPVECSNSVSSFSQRLQSEGDCLDSVAGESLDTHLPDQEKGMDLGNNTDSLHDKTASESVNKNASCSIERMDIESPDENSQSLDSTVKLETLDSNPDSWSNSSQNVTFEKTMDSPYHTTLESERAPDFMDADTLIESLEKDTDCVDSKPDTPSVVRNPGPLNTLPQSETGLENSVSSCSQPLAGNFHQPLQNSIGQVLADEFIPSPQTQILESSSIQRLSLPSQECLAGTSRSSNMKPGAQLSSLSNQLEEPVSELRETDPSSSFTLVNQSDTDRRKNSQSSGSDSTGQSCVVEQQVSHCSETLVQTSQSDDRKSPNCAHSKSLFTLQGCKEDDIFHQIVDGGQNSSASEKRKLNSGNSAADSVQIFQQVSTQVSSGIVQELRSRGILEESLQVIGQLCKVTWQQSGDTVTMTCDLEELCHAQSCFKQILKEGLQTFADPSPEPTSVSNNDATPQSAPKMPRKRGRPKGSKNKATLLKEAEEDGNQASKRTRHGGDAGDAVLENKAAEQNFHHQQPSHNSVKATSDSEKNKKTVSPQNKDSESRSPLGQYSGRTRGKRINFARLNAGNLSPARDDNAEETKPSPESESESHTAAKRSRGRPRKGNSAETDPTGEQKSGHKSKDGRRQDVVTRVVKTENASTHPIQEKTTESSAQSDSSRTQGAGTERDGRKGQETSTLPANEQTQKWSEQSDAQKAAVRDPSSKSSCENDLITLGDHTQDVSGCQNPSREHQMRVTNSASEVVWVPHVSVTGRRSQRSINPPSIPIVINTPKSPPKPFPTHPNMNSPVRIPNMNSPVRISAQANSLQIEIRNSNQCLKDRGKDEETKRMTNAESPMITKRAGALKRKHGSASFAIIPNVVFDFALDAEEHEKPKQPVQKNSVENSAEETTGEDADAFSEKGSETKGKHGERDLEIKMGNAATQTRIQTQTLFHCPVCKSAHETYRLLSDHISASHPHKASITCDVCQVVCPTPGALTLHLERRHGPKSQQTPPSTFRCGTCSKECVSSASLRWHRTLVHTKEGSHVGSSQSRLKCGLCHYMAVDSWDMRHHREQHRFQPIACCVCSKAFGTEASLKIHMAAKHSDQTHICHICHKAFAHMRYLRCHLQRHKGEKRHVCPICGWRFFQTNTLRAHMDTHKPKVQRRYAFRCPHCPAAYNSQANYRDHLNKHTGERPHMCGQCGRGFAFRSMLTTHVAFVHSSSRPYACTECDKKYKTKTQLRQHHMTHTMAKTGRSPFMCAKCSRPMASRSRLRAHSKCCKGGNFIWQPRGVSGRPQAKVQPVNMVGQPVNLVDLLPGQQINVVHHGFGKDATITLIPVQNDLAQDSAAVANPEENKSSLLQQEDSLIAEAWKAEELNKADACSDVLNPSSQLLDAAGMGESEQAVLVSEVESCLGELKNGAPASISVISNSGSSPALLVQNGQAVNLLSSLHITQLKDSEQAAEMSGSTSQSQSVSDTAPNFILEETFQSEPLQTVAPSHQLVFSDGFGQTQTLLLPPDLVKQEVVVIETEGGHQNILDLSNIQFIQDGNLQSDMDLDVRKDHTIQPAQVLQPSESEGIPVFQTSSDCPQAGENHLPVQDAEGVGGQGEACIYICSTCDQQFPSMELAQQHVLISHALEPPPGTSSLEETASGSMEAPNDALMNLSEAHLT